MSGARVIAVLDIGKTHLKLCAMTPDGQALEVVQTPNVVVAARPWPHHDLAYLTDWLGCNLSDLARRHDLACLVPVGHGSGGVLVGDDPDQGGTGAVLPMIDYEAPSPPALDACYAALCGTFQDRGSAVMMASTHAARQMLRMQMEAPDRFAHAAHYLNVAQYWAWWLSGQAASEISAMGAQSHLWNVPEGRAAPIVAQQGWAPLIPPFRRAWEALGPIRPALVARYGLPAALPVLTGAHDSSVNLYRYHAAGLSGATLVSTGTWIVALSARARLEVLDERIGMTLNADLTGAPVGGALCMGGREFAAVAGPDWGGAQADPDSLRALMARGTMALPAFGHDDGQFPGSAGQGRILGPPPGSPAERTALALLYSALLSVTCAQALQAGGDLVLDGSYLRDPLYAPLVAALWPQGRTLISLHPDGVAAGAALLAGHVGRDGPAEIALHPAPALPDLPGLSDYATAWHRHAKGALP